jgi:hypothetical protein
MRKSGFIIFLILFLSIITFVIPYGTSNSGGIIWNYELEHHQDALSMCTDAENIYACGTTYNSSAETKPDITLSKIAKDGSHQWTQVWMKEGSQWARKIVFDGTFLYLASVDYSVGTAKILIIKWDMDGNQVWNKTWDTDYEFFGITSLIVHENFIYMCLIEDRYAGPDNSTLFCYTSDGVSSWNRTFSSESDLSIKAYSVCILDDFLYACGEIAVTNDSSDLLLMKLDLSGNIIWNTTWGSSIDEKLIEILPLNQDLVICGQKWVDGERRTYVAKTDSSGDLLWEDSDLDRNSIDVFCIDVEDSYEPEIVVGGTLYRGPMRWYSLITGWNQDGEFYDVGISYGSGCFDIIKENNTIFICTDLNILALDGIPPYLRIPGYNIGILIAISSLITLGIVLKFKNKKNLRLIDL